MRIVFNRLGLKPLLVLLLTTLVLYKIQNAGFGSLSERGREEIEWLRTTKANLYRDKAKDGMNSSESLTENWIVLVSIYRILISFYLYLHCVWILLVPI